MESGVGLVLSKAQSGAGTMTLTTLRSAGGTAHGGQAWGPGPSGLRARQAAGTLEDLAKKVLSGEVERSKAAVACQLLNGARACIRDTLTAREKEELEAEIRLQAERLAALESVLKSGA